MSDQLTFDDREEDVRYRALWPMIVSRLSASLPPATAERFLTTLRPTKLRDGVATIEVPSAFNLSWVESRMSEPLTDALNEVLGTPVTLKFTVVPAERKHTPSANTAVSLRPTAASAGSHPLDSQYTFDNYVIGHSNQLAMAGAQAVAKDPGAKYNPLFIYGPPGVGKTHLLHAIRNYVQQKDPSMTIAYLTAMQFAEQFVQALGNRRIDHFRKSHMNVGLWLLDDIQFVAGKDRTQEEVFYVFNALQQTGKQIVLCSDRPPKELYLVEERLRSRFESGLVADIRYPDTETRSAILQSKARQMGVGLSMEVAMYVASQISGCVRTLEGALNWLVMNADVYKVPINLELAEQMIAQGYGKQSAPRPTHKEVVELVSKHFHIPVTDIMGLSRKAPIALARHVSVYLVRELTGDSWKHIGAQFGNRDHTSMMHAYQKISEMMTRDPSFDSSVRSILRSLQPPR